MPETRVQLTFGFSVEVSNENDCENADTISVEVKNCAFGVDEIFAATSIQVYPNPGNGEFTMSVQSPRAQVVNLSIMTSGGTRVYHKEGLTIDAGFNQRIQLPSEVSGVLILMIEKDGNYQMEKLIVR
jgi:type IX secretion system substrate protein